MSAFNGSGTFVISGSGLPVVTGTTISSTVQNTLNSDLATGLSTAVCKDGQTTPTANLPMGGYKHTGAAAATAAGQYLTYGGNFTEGTYTPDDASGAGLTFTSAFGFYRRIANIVHVWGSLTYPSTADTSGAKITLPVAVADLAIGSNGFQGIVQFNGGGGIPGGSAPNWASIIPNTSTFNMRYAGGVVMTNANLGAGPYGVWFYLCYPA